MRHSVHCSFCYNVHYPWFQKKNIFIIFYFVHYAMVMSKRNKISFQRYVHDAMIMKKLFILGFFFFFFCAFSICRNVFLLVLDGTQNVHTSLSCANINCYYGHYAAIMTKKYILLFQHYCIHYTVGDEKIFLFTLLLIATTFTAS